MPDTPCLDLITRHFDRFLATALDTYGPRGTAMWVSAVDIRNGGMPEEINPQEKRVYRLIHAPRGSTLYWDLPLLVAAQQLSKASGETRYREAAEAYLEDFLRLCVSPANGLFLWGNHIYYDVEADDVVKFSGGPHEIRPLPPAWDLLWRADPEQTAQAVRSLGIQHVHNPETGEFCRHGSVEATQPPPTKREHVHPFLEAGGLIAESLCWLGAKCPGEADRWNTLALRAAEYSFGRRGEETGLLRNQPIKVRWDYHAATTEVGFWSGCLVRAYRYSGEAAFLALAADAAKAYLQLGWDEANGKFYGMLDVTTGQPVAERTTPYQPDLHANVWEPLFPTHDYPMPFAEACLDLWELTGDEVFAEGARRWVTHIRHSLPPREGRGGYAEHYGRCLHFLLRAAQALDDPACIPLAREIAEDAISRLWCEETGMFRSHPGEDRADAVDGLGILFLALHQLETGNAPELYGFAF
jgi:hypothetical protein